MFKSIARIIAWTQNYKNRIYFGFLFSILDSIFIACPLFVTGIMVNKIYEDMKGISTLSTNDVYLTILLLLGFILLRWLCSYCRSVLQDDVAYMVSKKERLSVGEHLKKVPLGFFKKNNTGEINTVLTTEFSFFEMFAMSMIDIVANSYLFVVVSISFLFSINISIGLVALIAIIISSIGIYFINRLTIKKAPSRQKAIAEVTTAVLEYVRGMAIVKSYNQEGLATKAYKKACESARKINIMLETTYVFPESLHRIALYLGSCGVLYTVTMLYMNGEVPTNMWIMLALYSFVMFNGLLQVNSAILVLGIVNTTLDNLDKITKAKCIDDNGMDIQLNNYDISFKDVHFSYDKKEILKGISFNIPQSSTIALVCASGSGKTTICNLIARFYDVNSGAITIGGHNLQEFTCDSLLKNMTMVFQNVYLFNDTIRNNICFGKPNATEEEMMEVSKKARCHDFIMNLPDKYDTVIGEGGSTLSGGEKQRISIARAMLKDAQIVILDEATASVDPENEYYIQSAINELTKNKTVIIIAHRLKTIENADQIIVIDDGKIIQQGNHNTLIEQNGKYKDFINIRKQAEGWNI